MRPFSSFLAYFLVRLIMCGSFLPSVLSSLTSAIFLFSPPPPLHQVSADFIKSGEFTLERMGVTYKAKAHLKTPFDPENKRVKGIYA